MTVWQEVKSEMLSAIFDVLNFNCFYQRDPKFNKILLNVKCCFSVIEMNGSVVVLPIFELFQ